MDVQALGPDPSLIAAAMQGLQSEVPACKHSFLIYGFSLTIYVVILAFFNRILTHSLTHTLSLSLSSPLFICVSSAPCWPCAFD